MKIVLIVLMVRVSFFSITISCIWSIVEFILYLVKDKEFNWWSVYSIFISLFISLLVIVAFISTYLNIKNSVEEKNTFKGIVDPKKSRFQARLEDMKKERELRK